MVDCQNHRNGRGWNARKLTCFVHNFFSQIDFDIGFPCAFCQLAYRWLINIKNKVRRLFYDVERVWTYLSTTVWVSVLQEISFGTWWLLQLESLDLASCSLVHTNDALHESVFISSWGLLVLSPGPRRPMLSGALWPQWGLGCLSCSKSSCLASFFEFDGSMESIWVVYCKSSLNRPLPYLVSLLRSSTFGPSCDSLGVAKNQNPFFTFQNEFCQIDCTFTLLRACWFWIYLRFLLRTSGRCTNASIDACSWTVLRNPSFAVSPCPFHVFWSDFLLIKCTLVIYFNVTMVDSYLSCSPGRSCVHFLPSPLKSTPLTQVRLHISM